MHIEPQRVVGTYRRFGIVGPVYEILSKERDIENGDVMMRVVVLETGEEVECKLSDIIDDPVER